jgi:flagellar FliL protein
MSDTAAKESAPVKRSRWPLAAGFVLALVCGTGGFFAVRAGLVPVPGKDAAGDAERPASMPPAEVAFVPLEPIVVSLADGRHLRFTGELEVAPAHSSEVERLRPRIMDVLNTYLRALDESDIESPGALVRLRAQMLRRLQLVTGEGRVRDLLVMEFVMT